MRGGGLFLVCVCFVFHNALRYIFKLIRLYIIWKKTKYIYALLLSELIQQKTNLIVLFFFYYFILFCPEYRL